MLAHSETTRPTTIIEPTKLRDRLGLDITVVSEAFQHTGSFKFRAAYNVALNIDNDAVLTASSGNFGQAMAYACKLTGKRCTVVMPETSAHVKIEAVRNFGGHVDLIDVTKVGRSERVEQLAEEMPDAYVASPYDDELVIDGNSTLGDEIVDMAFDAVIVPVGGGGLISGVIRSFCRKGVTTEVIGAEPLLGNDAARSFRAGELIANDSEPKTIADGARTVSLGNLNWPIIKEGAMDFIEVSDEKIAEAVKLYFGLVNLKSEPTGALSLGAVLEDPARFKDKKVCVIVSGGNVDPDIYRSLI